MLALEPRGRARLAQEARATASSVVRLAGQQELDGDALVEVRGGCAATTTPMPPTPSTRSTRYLPARMSPGWGTPAVALDASPPPDASDPIRTPYRVALPPSTIFRSLAHRSSAFELSVRGEVSEDGFGCLSVFSGRSVEPMN